MAMKRKRSVSAYKNTPYKRPRSVTPVFKDRSDYQIVRAPKMDYKVSDYTTNVSVTSTGAIYTLHSNMTQGNNWINNYTGRTVDMVGLDVRYEVTGAVSNAILTADQNNKTRVLIFQWMDDAAPTIASTFQVTGANATLSPIDIPNYENINVLHDCLYDTWVTATVTGYASSNAYNKRVFIKKKKLRPIDFNTTTGGVSKGGLYMALVSDSGSAPNPTVAFYSRMTFTDA